MRLFRPIPRAVSRPASLVILAAWLAAMGMLIHRSYLAVPIALAADLARYGASAQWKGIYYRGEKIGFSVDQTVAKEDGYELREDGRLQLNLLGGTSAVRLRATADVDPAFALRSFSFSLDPGTGPTEIRGTLRGRRLSITIRTPSGERREERDLPEPPALPVSFPRQLAAAGLRAGQTHHIQVFDPTTLRNAEMVLVIKGRELVDVAGRPTPAFRVETRYLGIAGTSWITDVGDIVREESPMGMMTVRETPARAQAMAVPGQVQADMLESAAIVPGGTLRIDDPTAVERLRVRLTGIESFPREDLEGAGQAFTGDDTIETVDVRTLSAGPADPAAAAHFLHAEPFLESDAPEIRAEAERALAGVNEPKARAERLVRHVYALLEKKPTVSLPSALEVLRTRVGDCNEHATLYVALARAAGIPARMDTGLVYLRGAFYYHAWAEVYVASGVGGGWIPVDPTLNQFPADATHLRLARGGIDHQAAILGLLGAAKMTVLDLSVRPGSTPVLVGQSAAAAQPLDISLPRRQATGRGCWSSPGR